MTILANSWIPGGINIEKKATVESRKRDEKKTEARKRYGNVISYFSYKDEINSEVIRHRLKDHLAN